MGDQFSSFVVLCENENILVCTKVNRQNFKPNLSLATTYKTEGNKSTCYRGELYIIIIIHLFGIAPHP